MRIQRFLTTIALALTPVIASAQTNTTPAPAVPPANGQQPAVAQPDTAPSEYVPKQRNVIDFGVRGTNISGDSARYERFRDLGNGLFFDGFQLSRQTKNDWFLDVLGEHVGRLDQAFYGSVVRPGKVKAQFSWDQTPTLMSRTTQTIFTEKAPNVLTINSDLRAAVQQNGSATLGALLNNYERQFDLKSHRYTGQGSVEVMPNADFTLKATFKHMDRDGSMPYGGSFGHGNFIETIAPVKHQLNNFDGGGEFMHGPVLLRAGYTASLFHNDYTTLTFDNPWRAVDATAGSSVAATSLPPSNSFVSVNGLASVKMAGHSRATAYVSTGLLKDAGDPIMSQTPNTKISGLAQLPRNTVDGEARTTSVNLTFSSRPTQWVDFKARYRNYDYNNRTPEFVLPQRVAFDTTASNATYSSLGGVTSALGLVETEPFGITRGSFDVDFGVTPGAGSGAGIGYSRLTEDRTHRTLEKTTENIVRVTFDQVANQWFSLRAKFEHGQKRGDLTQEAVLDLWNIGEQPGTRQFDIASRDRDRGTILGTVNLGSLASVNASFAAGKDDYIESQFGLRDNTNRIYGAGFDIAPTETTSFGLTYAFEKYTALSRSRTANPPTAQTPALPAITYDQYLEQTRLPTTAFFIADASRNWANDSADRVHTLVASAEFLKIAEKVDLKFSVDLSRAKTTFNYLLGPVKLLQGEPSVATSLASPVQLPANTSNFGRFTGDATYALTEHVGIGVSYWYEQYRVKDFSLDETATPSLAFGPNSSAVLSGYLYRPYTANTVWGRLIYRW